MVGWASRLSGVAATASVFLVLLGASVLVGWALNSVPLTSGIPGLVPMNPGTAHLTLRFYTRTLQQVLAHCHATAVLD